METTEERNPYRKPTWAQDNHPESPCNECKNSSAMANKGRCHCNGMCGCLKWQTWFRKRWRNIQKLSKNKKHQRKGQT